MSQYISKKTRQAVKERAHHCCEYCKVLEMFSVIGFEIDHIIPKKHGGDHHLLNLAWVCAICNYFKGTDVATFLLPARELVRFFNPRTDLWDDHFEISGSLILPKTKIGEATLKIFRLNEKRRMDERQSLVKAGLFPPSFPLLN